MLNIKGNFYASLNLVSSHPGPHGFSSVNPEAHDSDVDEMVEITSNHHPDVIRSSVQVCQSNQVTVAHLVWISVVVDVTWEYRVSNRKT